MIINLEENLKIEDIDNYEEMKKELKKFVKESQDIILKKEDNLKLYWDSVKKSEEEYINLMVNCHKEYEELVKNTKEQFQTLREQSKNYLKKVK